MKKKPFNFESTPVVSWIYTDTGKGSPVPWSESPISRGKIEKLVNLLAPKTNGPTQPIDPRVRDEIAKEIIICFIKYKAYINVEFEHKSLKAKIDELSRLRTELEQAIEQLPDGALETRLAIAKSDTINRDLQYMIVERCRIVKSRNLKKHFKNFPMSRNVPQIYMVAQEVVLKVIREVASEKIVKLNRHVRRGPKIRTAEKNFRIGIGKIHAKYSECFPCVDAVDFENEAKRMANSYIQRSWNRESQKKNCSAANMWILQQHAQKVRY